MAADFFPKRTAVGFTGRVDCFDAVPEGLEPFSMQTVAAKREATCAKVPCLSRLPTMRSMPDLSPASTSMLALDASPMSVRSMGDECYFDTSEHVWDEDTALFSAW